MTWKLRSLECGGGGGLKCKTVPVIIGTLVIIQQRQLSEPLVDLLMKSMLMGAAHIPLKVISISSV